MSANSINVGRLAVIIGAELVGDGSAVIGGVQSLEAAGPEDVTFMAEARMERSLRASTAAAVIVSGCIEDLAMPQLVVGNVHAALIRALELFAPDLIAPVEGVDPSASVAADAVIDPGCSIGPNAVIGPAVRIGAGSTIGAGCSVGQGVQIGKKTRLDPNVVIYRNCVLGGNVIIQSGAVIGATGFGYHLIDGRHRLVPHNGAVSIGDFVEIGANTCIDRGKFGNTIIGAGTKIDNLCQIGHNVVIGKNCLIAALVGIAGSCRLGDGVVLGGQVGLADHVVVGDGTMIGAQSGVMDDLGPGLKVLGAPPVDVRRRLQEFVLIRRLPQMADRLKRLEGKLYEREAADHHKD